LVFHHDVQRIPTSNILASMGRPFRLSISHTSRPIFHNRWRLVVVFLFAALLQQQHLFHISRQSLAAKYSSTDFNEEVHRALPRGTHEDARVEDDLIAHRKDWKVLGGGWEGKVYAYNGSVIKTFTPGRSPFRNCAPGDTREKWPTEITASLRFGGSSLKDNGNNGNNTPFDGFLPVYAYFKAINPPSAAREWHLVTPLLKRGNLVNEAKRLARDEEPLTHQDVDARYRPVFERFLDTIQRLHEHGYCHDDVKPANIFVKDKTNWVLGDLGNVRHVNHPYHTSRLWKDNQQLEDCRANDLLRALKSYLQFVRSAASNRDAFDKEFFEMKAPLSRLFWRASAEAPHMSARQLQELSVIEKPQGPEVSTTVTPPARPSSLLAIISSRWSLPRAVESAIETRIGEKLARWWAMVYVFGVPNRESCDV